MVEKSAFEIWAHRGGTSGGSPENSLKAISNTLENRCNKLELDVWRYGKSLVLTHDQPTNGNHPSLSQALKLINGRAEIYLEIKHAEAALEVHKLIEKEYTAHYDSIIFASFELEVLESIRAESAMARLGLNYRGVDDRFIDIAEELAVEYVTFNWRRFLPNYFNIKQSGKILNTKYLAYTVNTPILARLMQRLGMDGIITDYPGRF